jgi:hypothetical protein
VWWPWKAWCQCDTFWTQLRYTVSQQVRNVLVMLLSGIAYGAQWPSEMQLHDMTVSLQSHSISYTTYWTTQGHQVTRLASLESLETTVWLAIYLIRWRSVPFSPSIVVSHLCYKVRFLLLTICISSGFSTIFLELTSMRPCRCHQMLLPAQAQVQVGLAGYALSPIPVENRGVWLQCDCVMFLR